MSDETAAVPPRWRVGDEDTRKNPIEPKAPIGYKVAVLLSPWELVRKLWHEGGE